jgi:hypothetical protein
LVVQLSLTGDGHDVAQPPTLQKRTESRVGAVNLIRRHPAGRQSRLQRASEHPPGEFRFGGELDLVRNAGRTAARAVSDPVLGEIELAVDERLTLGGAVGTEDTDLTVLDAAGCARVHPSDAGAPLALLQEARFVDDQHAVRLAQMLGDIADEVVAHRISVPPRTADEVLKVDRRGVAGELRQLPAVLPLDAGHETPQVVRCPSPKLRTAEPRLNPLGHPLQLPRPPRNVPLRHLCVPPDLLGMDSRIRRRFREIQL